MLLWHFIFTDVPCKNFDDQNRLKIHKQAECVLVVLYTRFAIEIQGFQAMMSSDIAERVKNTHTRKIIRKFMKKRISF